NALVKRDGRAVRTIAECSRQGKRSLRLQTVDAGFSPATIGCEQRLSGGQMLVFGRSDDPLDIVDRGRVAQKVVKARQLTFAAMRVVGVTCEGDQGVARQIQIVQIFGDFVTIEPWHSDIEKDEMGIEILNRLYGGLTSQADANVAIALAD